MLAAEREQIEAIDEPAAAECFEGGVELIECQQGEEGDLQHGHHLNADQLVGDHAESEHGQAKAGHSSGESTHSPGFVISGFVVEDGCLIVAGNELSILDEVGRGPGQKRQSRLAGLQGEGENCVLHVGRVVEHKTHFSICSATDLDVGDGQIGNRDDGGEVDAVPECESRRLDIQHNIDLVGVTHLLNVVDVDADCASVEAQAVES